MTKMPALIALSLSLSHTHTHTHYTIYLIFCTNNTHPVKMQANIFYCI